MKFIEKINIEKCRAISDSFYIITLTDKGGLCYDLHKFEDGVISPVCEINKIKLIEMANNVRRNIIPSYFGIKEDFNAIEATNDMFLNIHDGELYELFRNNFKQLLNVVLGLDKKIIKVSELI